MSVEKLQQAIALIKSGDKKGGQNLLIDIVNADPNNEAAWLWLASVVSADKQVFCLEKVLNINPNNLQAKQYLEKLKAGKQTQTSSTTQSNAASQEKESTVKATEPSSSNLPQLWTVPFGDKLASIISLENTKLTTLDVVPASKAPAILSQFNHGALTKQWADQNSGTTNYKSINLDQISQVRLLFSDIKLQYRDKAMKELSAEITCRKDKVAEEIFEALQNMLGNDFTRTTKANSRWEVASRSLVVLLITSAVIGFCYWGTIDLGTEELHGRYSGIGTLIQLIGPNGVLCIGGGVLILFLIAIISQFIKPPTETLLIRKGSPRS